MVSRRRFITDDGHISYVPEDGVVEWFVSYNGGMRLNYYSTLCTLTFKNRNPSEQEEFSSRCVRVPWTFV